MGPITRRGFGKSIALATVTNTSAYREAANHFAESYNAWIKLREGSDKDILNAKEVVAWKAVVTAWDALKKMTKY